MAGPSRKEMLRFLSQLGAFILTRFGFWNCFCMLMLFAERADSKRKPDIHVPYLYVDMGAAVLCASFMSFGVKRRWFAMAAAVQLAVSTYASYIGEQVYYGDWLKVRMYSRAMAIIGGFLVLASGAGEVYRQKPRSRSMQSTGQVFLGVYLICMGCQAHDPLPLPPGVDHVTRGETPIRAGPVPSDRSKSDRRDENAASRRHEGVGRNRDR
ncbi:transmembrane protein 101 isoform X2 [Amphiprion ocellaris]|uniref:transmembrane protein 101 isoform X2 n=1 Tax=Amphiprion ocellaris TaxID=80972 RepID=UPI0024112DAF|nr:transmembrane protein 101 isoform X2 [Amphiprion ocellaris]